MPTGLSGRSPIGLDKGGTKHGIPKPAGAGGGSSSLSLDPFEGLTRFTHLESRLRLSARRVQPLAVLSSSKTIAAP
jgi:hypothetical protein